MHRFLAFLSFLEKLPNVSFSNVKYQQMAPRVGLEPTCAGNDMPTFDVHRARIPTPLFKDIIRDLEIAMKQYGEPFDQHSAQARSRVLAPVSEVDPAAGCSFVSDILSCSTAIICHVPGSVIAPGRITTKGRIESHFLVLGGLSVLLIEVQYVLGRAEERLNAIAQVMAECDGIVTQPIST